MKNYLFHKINMLSTLAVCLVVGGMAQIAFAQSPPNITPNQYWYIATPADATRGNSINGVTTHGFVSNENTTVNGNFRLSKWGEMGISNSGWLQGENYSVVPNAKGGGAFTFGRWGNWTIPFWWSVSIYTKEELSKDIDVINSIAINVIGNFPLYNKDIETETHDFAVFVYETNDNEIRPGNSWGFAQQPAYCAYLPTNADGTDMSDLHSPAQIEDNVWIDNSTGIYDLAQGGAVNETRAQTYIETWLNHNAFLIERRNVGISEMKDNAWIEFSTKTAGTGGYKYKGGNLVVVMLQIKNVFPLAPTNTNNDWGLARYMSNTVPRTYRGEPATWYFRNYDALDRCWYAQKGSPTNNYEWSIGSTNGWQNRGAGNYAVRLEVDAYANDYVNTLPAANMAVAQAGNNFWPRVYHRNPNVFDRTYDAAKFSYKIIQNSTGNVVYRGKSGTGEHDTLIIANTQADFTEISMAVGDYARANGTFVVLPEEHTDEQMPALGDYTAIITWQTFSDAGYDNSKGLYPTRMQQRMEVPFTIVDPITTVKGVRPTWNTPITVGQALTSSMQPSVVTSKSWEGAVSPTVSYRISKAAVDAAGNYTGELGTMVYEAMDSTNSTLIDIVQNNIGEFTHRFTNSTSTIADADNPGNLDISKLEAGKYYISLVSNYASIPGGSNEDINNIKYDSFLVAPAQELEIVDVSSPVTTDGAGVVPDIDTIGLEYTVAADMDIPLEYTVTNYGSQTCSTHVFTAEIYNNAGALVTTVKDTSLVPIEFFRTITIKSKKTFSLTDAGKIYSIKARVDFLEDIDEEINKSNNIYPRDEYYSVEVDPTQTKKVQRYFFLKAAYGVSLTTQVHPSGTSKAYRYPVYPTIAVRNTGSTDVNGLIVNLLVTKPKANAPGQIDTVLMESKPLSNIKINSTDLTDFSFNTLLFPDTACTYTFNYTYTTPDGVGGSVVRTAAIDGGLGKPGETTIYTIGKTGNYSTIRRALEALYTMGVQGHVVFEISAEADPTTGEFLVDASHFDLRSKIVGAGPNATITFRPSATMMSETLPLTLVVDPTTYSANEGLRTDDWFGVAFGDGSKPRIDVAAVNNVVEPEWKRFFAESNGYITLDGGERKNLQIEYKGQYNNAGRWLAAPIYLGAGSNHITIKNCRIITQDASMQTNFDIPATYYDDPNYHASALSGFRYEPLSNTATNSANVYTTAGIFMHARPLDQLRLSNVLYTFNRNTSDSNTIEGNYIHGFGYGIFSLGMGANIDADTIKPMYNKGNRYADNLITLSGSDGIFLGFEENAVVSHNRIANVTGSQSPVSGIRVGKATDEARSNSAWKLDGIELNINNYNVTIERNEINNIRGYANSSAFGILITEPTDTLQYINKPYAVLDRLAASYNAGAGKPTTHSYRIINNVVYDIVSSGGIETNSSRAGVAVIPSAAETGILPDANSYYNHARHKINSVQVANNTIILDDKTASGTPSVNCNNLYIAGIKLFDAESYEIINNAIAIKIDTAYKYGYISALALRSQNPKTVASSINVNYNAYSVFDAIAGYPGNAKVYNEISAFVRFFELDKYGRLLNENGGFAKEYNTLRNWYSWTGSDKNSIEYNFLNEIEAEGSKAFWSGNVETTIRRMLSTNEDKVSQLDKGLYIDYVATDIDGTNRLLLGKYFNIGAMEFTSRHNNYDLSVLAISQPAAYLNPEHIYSTEEQIMLPGDRQNQDIQPKAIVKNNGTIPLSNVPVVCTVVSSEITPRFTISDTVWTNLPIGEEKEITFFTRSANRFTPQTYRESGIAINNIDAQYRSMINNVSPVYNIKIGFVPSFNLQYGDANKQNDSLMINARFFAPRSERSLLVSAKHSHEELYKVVAGERVGDETNPEIIAGRLNYDTVVAALAHVGLAAPADESDPVYYDVLERTAWEPRAVVYDQYSGVIYSDALDDEMDYWEKKPLLDYVNNATITNKRTLIVGSEGVLAKNNYSITTDLFDKELNEDILRSKAPQTIAYTGNIVITGARHNQKLDIELANTGYDAINPNTQQHIGDVEPAPHSFKIIDTVLGVSNAAYHVKDNTEAVVVASIKMLEKNMIHSAIDWRHLKNAAAFMEGIFGDVGNEINRPGDGLGIELADFNANAIGKKVSVDWTTLSEGGITNFEVQRADVSNNLSGLFSSIDSKLAKGVDNVTSNYNIFDENVNYGQEYAYRLKINDIEGKYTYSPIKIVNIEYADGVRFGEVTPNPVSDHYANTDFTLTKEANVIVTINDLSGKEVMTLWSGFANAGTHPLTIDASKLATGTYTIIYNIGGNVVKTTMFNVAK